MKILLINNFHYRKGGSEAVYFNMADMFVRHGHKVVFFSCNDEHNLPCEQSDFFTRNNAELNRVCRSIRYVYNREAKRKLEALIRTEKPDIAHIHLFWGGLSSSILSVLRKHKIPIVHTAHDYRMICPAYTFRRPNGEICERCKGTKYYNCTLGRCSKGRIAESLLMSIEMYLRNRFFNPTHNIDGFVFVSKFARDKHFEFMPSFKSTQNIVAYNSAPPVSPEFIGNGRGNYFLFFGRLSHEKGVQTLIEAFIARPNLRLRIVGTGPEEERLRTRVEAANAKNIEFVGYHTGKSLQTEICNAAYVIVPSEWYENNPLTIIEAYAAAIPVIGARIGGIPEIIEEGETGYLFESGNAESLATTLDKADAMPNNDYAKMSENAKRFAEQNFNENENYKKIIALYNSIIENYER